MATTDFSNHEAEFEKVFFEDTGSPPAYTVDSAAYAAFLALSGLTVHEAARVAQERANRARLEYSTCAVFQPTGLSRQEAVEIESGICTRWAFVSLGLAVVGAVIALGLLLAGVEAINSVFLSSPLLVLALVIGSGVTLAERINGEIRHESMREAGTNGLRRVLSQGGEPMFPLTKRRNDSPTVTS